MTPLTLTLTAGAVRRASAFRDGCQCDLATAAKDNWPDCFPIETGTLICLKTIGGTKIFSHDPYNYRHHRQALAIASTDVPDEYVIKEFKLIEI